MMAISAGAGIVQRDMIPQDLLPDFVTRLPSGFLGEIAPSAPVIRPLDRRFDMSRQGFSLSAVAEISLQSVVLARRRYLFDDFRISPVDLALGWGAMSNPSIFRTVRVSIRDRMHHWDIQPPPRIEGSEVTEMSGTFQLIPLRLSLEDDITRLKRNQTVRISGYLCDVTTPRGIDMPASDVIGNGARRHILLVESAKPVLNV